MKRRLSSRIRCLKKCLIGQDSIKLFLVSSKSALLARKASDDKKLEKKSNFESLEEFFDGFSIERKKATL